MASRLKKQTATFTELAEWLAENNLTPRAFARLRRIDKMTLNRLLNGTMKRFDARLVQKISDGTDAAVGHPQFAAYLQRLTAPKRKVAA